MTTSDDIVPQTDGKKDKRKRRNTKTLFKDATIATYVGTLASIISLILGFIIGKQVNVNKYSQKTFFGDSVQYIGSKIYSRDPNDVKMINKLYADARGNEANFFSILKNNVQKPIEIKNYYNQYNRAVLQLINGKDYFTPVNSLADLLMNYQLPDPDRERLLAIIGNAYLVQRVKPNIDNPIKFMPVKQLCPEGYYDSKEGGCCLNICKNEYMPQKNEKLNYHCGAGLKAVGKKRCCSDDSYLSVSRDNNNILFCCPNECSIK